jgi:hypothetical protein
MLRARRGRRRPPAGEQLRGRRSLCRSLERSRSATDTDAGNDSDGSPAAPEERRPAPHEWQALLEAAAAYTEAAPWERVGDTPAVGVEDPEGGPVGYSSVLGADGLVRGLVVFRGPEGFAAYQRMLHAPDATSWEAPAALFTAPVLHFAQGGRGQVPPEDRQAYRALGQRFRGTDAWPVFRSQRPGYLPWPLTASEARFLTTALRAVTAFSLDPAGLALLQQMRATRGDAGDPQRVLLLREHGGAVQTAVAEVQPRAAYIPDATFDEVRARRLRDSSERTDATWELDLLPAPFGIGAAGQRLRASWLGLAVDRASGLALHAEAYPTLQPLRPSEFVLAVVEKTGQRPAAIHVYRREVADGLAPVARALGCRVSAHPRLPAFQECFDALLEAHRTRP